jgi:hypothetical protein
MVQFHKEAASMAFRDLDELLDAGLSLPYRGKTYLVPSVDAATGLRFQRLAEVAAQAVQAAETGQELDAELLDDTGEIDLYRDALGPAYEAMLADRVPWPVLKTAAVTAWLDAAVSREAAEAYWNAAGTPDPEALAGNRASRRAARSTRPRASASGTTRTRKTATGTGTPGRRSSNTGR